MGEDHPMKTNAFKERFDAAEKCRFCRPEYALATGAGLPCSTLLLRAATVALEAPAIAPTGIFMSDLSAFFQSVKLPVMPEVAHALIRTLHEEDIVLGDVRNIVAKDPTLTAKVLRAANSAAIGLRREVSTLDAAISMIGMAQVRTLALTACMNVAFPVAPGLNRTEFWMNSMACAGYAQWLAPAAGVDWQQAWLAGMMVRLGELIIVQTVPDTLPEIERQPQIPGDRWKREQHVLGFTEAQVTAELARRWRFPAGIVQGLDSAS